MSAAIIKLPVRPVPDEVVDRMWRVQNLVGSSLYDAEKRGDFLTASPLLTEAAGIYADMAAAGYGAEVTKEYWRRINEFVEAKFKEKTTKPPKNNDH